jgi:predicted transcriptional regulator of viral defense system
MNEYSPQIQKWLALNRPFSASEFIAEGLSRHLLTHLCNKGLLSRMECGVYLPENADFSENLSLQIAALRVPHCVVCLISALRFHEFTTQLSPDVWLAIPQHSRIPALSHTGSRIFMLSETPYEYGIEEHDVDGVKIHVYSAAKTVADCFKFRNQVGTDVAIEALQDGLRRRRFTADELTDAAEACRVSKVITPYMETVLA